MALQCPFLTEQRAKGLLWLLGLGLEPLRLGHVAGSGHTS